MVAIRLSLGSSCSETRVVSTSEQDEVAQPETHWVKGSRIFRSVDEQSSMLQEYAALQANKPIPRGAVAALAVKWKVGPN